MPVASFTGGAATLLAPGVWNTSSLLGSTIGTPISVNFTSAVFAGPGGSSILGFPVSSLFTVNYSASVGGGADVNFAFDQVTATGSGVGVTASSSTLPSGWDVLALTGADINTTGAYAPTAGGFTSLSVTDTDFDITYGTTSVDSISPSSGSIAGGDVVTITFDDIDALGIRPGDAVLDVEFGAGNFGTGHSHTGDLTFDITTPSGTGTVDVIISFYDLNGNIVSMTVPNGFTYGAGLSWWFNSSTNTYTYSGTNPGGGFGPATSDPVPDIESISARQGLATGGTPFTIVGTGFGTGATVSIGGVAATSVVVHDQTMITGVTGSYGGALSGPNDITFGPENPEHSGEPGRADTDAVDVVVTNLDGEDDSLLDGFLYYTLLSIPWVVPGVPGTPIVPSTTSPGGGYTVGATPTDDGWWMSIENFGGAAYLLSASVPRDPREWTKIDAFATTAAKTAWMGGFPGVATIWNNRLVYAANNYTGGTDRPTIHIFDGSFDRQITTVPPASSGTVPKGVMSMLTANGLVYVATLDSGASDADWLGRVFSLDIETGKLTQVGGAFTTGHIPYALAWHGGKLWMGTHRKTASAVGKLYSIRPGVDAEWTTEFTLNSGSVTNCTSLLSYKGLLYVGTSNASGSFARVLVRGTDGSFTTSLTATGGTAAANNAFLALTEFDDNLYASFYNDDGTPVSKIYQFDNSSWTTVYTAGSAATRVPYIALFSDEGKVFALGGGWGITPALLRSDDGATWTDLSAFLTDSNPDCTAVPAFGVVVR